MNKIHRLETTLERVGRILSRSYHINVHCKGTECKTDGRTIWLPSLPEKVPEGLWQLVRGEIDHEVAHILYSDFHGKMKEIKTKWGQFGHDLLNVIEDVRVNYAVFKEYPGSQENIENAVQTILQKQNIAAMPLPVRLLSALFLAGMGIPYDRYGKLVQVIVDQFKTEIQQFKSLKTTDEACDLTEEILRRFQKKPPKEPKPENSNPPNSSQNSPNSAAKSNSPKPSTNESDSAQVEPSSNNEDFETDQEPNDKKESDDRNSASKSASADEITEHKKPTDSETGEEDQNHSESSSDSESEDPTAGLTNGLGQENPKPPQNMEKEKDDRDTEISNLDTQDEIEESNSDSSEVVSEGNLDNPIPASPGSLQKLLDENYSSAGHPFELAGQIRQQVQENYEDINPWIYRVYDTSQDQLRIPDQVDTGESYQKLLSQVRPQVGALRQQLFRTLKAREARFWVGEQEAGTIHSRRLYTLLSTESTKVFRQKQKCVTDSVAVTLLIDLSGSMDGTRIILTRQVAILFAETLHQLRIPSEVLGFSTQEEQILGRIMRETDLGLLDLCKLYTRLLPMDYLLFKSFNEPFRVLKVRVPAMVASWYTPLDEAVLFTAKRIIQRKEKRKLILILTDGEPYNGNAQSQPMVAYHLKQILKKISQVGIECVAVGIQTDFVQRFFPDNVVVYNLAELPKLFYAKFSELLRRSRD